MSEDQGRLKIALKCNRAKLVKVPRNDLEDGSDGVDILCVQAKKFPSFMATLLETDHISPLGKKIFIDLKVPSSTGYDSSHECILVTVMGHFQVLPTKTRVTVRVKIGIPEPHGIHGTYDNSEKNAYHATDSTY